MDVSDDGGIKNFNPKSSLSPRFLFFPLCFPIEFGLLIVISFQQDNNYKLSIKYLNYFLSFMMHKLVKLI